jgi:hypothetical protein
MTREQHDAINVDRSIGRDTEKIPTSTAERARILRDMSKLKPRDGDLIAKSKVEFLHRTVLDFLDRPEIWEQFLAATDNSFKPNAALAQSWLLQLKWVYSDTLSVPCLYGTSFLAFLSTPKSQKVRRRLRRPHCLMNLKGVQR